MDAPLSTNQLTPSGVCMVGDHTFSEITTCSPDGGGGGGGSCHPGHVTGPPGYAIGAFGKNWTMEAEDPGGVPL